MKITRQYRIILYIIAVILLTILMFWVNRKDSIEIKIDYGKDMIDKKTWNAVIVDMGNGYLTDDLEKGYPGNYHRDYKNEITIKLPQKYNDFKSFVFKLQPNKHLYSIKCIEIFNHNTLVYKFGPDEMLKYFDFKNIDSTEKQRAYLIIRTEGSDPLLEGNDEFNFLYNQVVRGNTRWLKNIFIFGIVLLGLFVLADYHFDNIIKVMKSFFQSVREAFIFAFSFNTSDLETIVVGFCKFILVISIVLITVMAMFSPIYAHADEPVYRAAIDFYTGKWLPERIDSNLSIGTFSEYGFSRLDEPTWYYLFAGKMAWIAKNLFDSTVYYRIGNIVLYVALLIFLCSRSKYSKGIIMAMCLTPQIWYLYSYPTSDAWDLLWSFVAVYEVFADNSCLNKYLHGEKGKLCFNLVVPCLPFAFILAGKKNFYIVLLFVFMILFFRLFEVQHSEVMKLLIRYITILVLIFIFLGIRKGIDRFNYQIDKRGKVVSIAKENNLGYGIADEKKEIRDGINRSLEEVIEKRALQDTFTSSVGGYGWLEYRGEAFYNRIMFIGTISLLILLAINSYTIRGISVKLISISTIGYVILMYAMVIYNCMVADFQPQGRYTMPLYPIIGYVMARQMKEKKLLNVIGILVMILAIFSWYSFCGIGLYNIVLKNMSS